MGPQTFAACKGRAVGKSVEAVNPDRSALPAASTAMPRPFSSPLPTRYVEYMSPSPSALSLATKASVLPPEAACKGGPVMIAHGPESLGQVGKLVESVAPAT